MSRIGAKKRIPSNNEGSKGKKRSSNGGSNVNLKMVQTTPKSIPQRQKSNIKRTRQSSKGKDESTRLSIDSKWQESTKPINNNEKITRRTNKVTMKTNLDAAIANFENMMSNH